MGVLLTLIVKATRRCNLRCTYCNDWRAGGPVISEDVIDSMVDSAFGADAFNAVHFNWHGGEPTLVPLGTFEHAVAQQRAKCPPGKVYTNTLQTNATLLTEPWLDFLAGNRFAVGVSLDGPREMHERHRPTAGGRGSFDAALDGIRRLEAWRVPHGCTVVASSAMVAAGAGTLWSFLSEAGLSSVNMVPVRPPNRPGGRVLSPTVHAEFVGWTEWTGFMCELFDLWWNSDRSVRIAEFDALQRKIDGRSSPSCLIAGGCLGNVFGVEPDGTLMHCELFQGEPSHRFGDIRDVSIDEARRSSRMLGLQAKDRERVDRYHDCVHRDVCSGGCPWEWSIHEAYGRETEIGTCCGWAPLISHIMRAM